MSQSILQIKDLTTYFHLEEGILKAVDGVSFNINRGETLSLVGESGCGKSVTALSILQLVDQPPARIHAGQALLEGIDTLSASEKEINKVRGRLISMVFQEPMTSLNPLLSIGLQIREPLIHHLKMTGKQARQRSVELLELVDIGSPKKRLAQYPHQLSGGQRQRVMIALALACNPQVLIADEPTTALDVTVQAQILDLLRSIQEKIGTSILLITHDLGVVAENSHQVAVMYAGKIVEQAEVVTLFKNHAHPYTQGLLESVPLVDPANAHKRLTEIPGMVPNLTRPIKGCRFSARCPKTSEDCLIEEPTLRSLGDGHMVRCWQT